MSNISQSKEGFLLELWERIFYFLSKISLFSLIRKCIKNTSYRFVDIWVLGNFLFAMISSIILYFINSKFVVIFYVINVYGISRIFEIIIYQINVLLFDPYRSKLRGEEYRVKSIRRILIALLHNFVEIIFWYSVITITVVKLSIGISQSWLEFVTSNILCMTTFDRGILESVVDIKVEILSIIGTCEVVSGLIMTVVSLGRFIGILPAVKELDE